MGVITRDGQLRDFTPRTGDERDRQAGVAPSAAQKWGGRTLISNFRSLTDDKGVRDRATVIRTNDLGYPTNLNLQLRWAQNTGGNIKRGQPILPFEYKMPGSATKVRVRIRRGIDLSSAVTEDEYDVFLGQVLPIDMISARELGVEVIAIGNAVDDTTVWVEAVCSPVTYPGPTNLIHPWAVATNPTFTAATDTATSLLGFNTQRVQFFIVNTSTNANLIIQLGKGPNGDDPTWTPNPLGTYVLPKNNFFVYESPCPCGFKGTVFGVWDNATPDGGAMVHEGVVF